MKIKFSKVAILFASFLFMFLSINACFTGCKLFEEPEGESELLSVYTKDIDDNHYLNATLKISNTSDKIIYNSTVSIQADTNLHSYYKTLSLDITIEPDSSIYIPVQMEFTQKSTETPKEEWNKSSFRILSETFK
ncbi:MAG: hypothetical protein K6A89_11415 [Treponema sp.]|nr:hypothetical protein [Treponema sp.]